METEDVPTITSAKYLSPKGSPVLNPAALEKNSQLGDYAQQLIKKGYYMRLINWFKKNCDTSTKRISGEKLKNLYYEIEDVELNDEEINSMKNEVRKHDPYTDMTNGPEEYLIPLHSFMNLMKTAEHFETSLKWLKLYVSIVKKVKIDKKPVSFFEAFSGKGKQITNNNVHMNSIPTFKNLGFTKEEYLNLIKWFKKVCDPISKTIGRKEANYMYENYTGHFTDYMQKMMNQAKDVDPYYDPEEVLPHLLLNYEISIQGFLNIMRIAKLAEINGDPDNEYADWIIILNIAKENKEPVPFVIPEDYESKQFEGFHGDFNVLVPLGHGCDNALVDTFFVPPTMIYITSSKCGLDNNYTRVFQTGILEALKNCHSQEEIKEIELHEIQYDIHVHYSDASHPRSTYVNGLFVPVSKLNYAPSEGDGLFLSGLVDLRNINYTSDFSLPFFRVDSSQPNVVYINGILEETETPYKRMLEKAFEFSIYPKLEEVLTIYNSLNMNTEDHTNRSKFQEFLSRMEFEFEITYRQLFKMFPAAVYYSFLCRTSCDDHTEVFIEDTSLGKETFPPLVKRRIDEASLGEDPHVYRLGSRYVAEYGDTGVEEEKTGSEEEDTEHNGLGPGGSTYDPILHDIDGGSKYKTRKGKTRKVKTRKGKTRKVKTRKGKTRKGKKLFMNKKTSKRRA